MQNLNIIILSKDRSLQVKALIESFYLNLKTYHPTKFTVLHDSNWTDNYLFREAYTLLTREFSYVDFNLVDFKDPLNLESYFKEDEFNLVLTDNVIFSCPFDLTGLYFLEDNEILDLFKGLNRSMSSEGKFFYESHKWGKRDSLYFIESPTDCFEDVTGKFPQLGKIFKVGNKPLKERTHFFFGISPCFINAISTEDLVDGYDMESIIEYGQYPLCMRHLVGEKIDVRELQGYCPNKAIDQYPFKFTPPWENKKIEDFVKHRFYINLDDRADRRNYVTAQTERAFNLKFERKPGVIPSDQEVADIVQYLSLDQHSLDLAKARIGCTKSHLELVQMAKDNDWDNILILEDDCEFLEGAQGIFEQAISELERLPKWDLLFLGANVRAPLKQLSPHIGELTGAFCLHAYIVPKHFYDTYLNYEWKEYKTIDEWSFNICRDQRFKAYTVLPIIATQYTSYSDIEGKEVHYRQVLINSYTEFLNKCN